MGMFHADLAFTVELIAVALGFYFLHLSKKEKSKHLRIGAFILIIGGFSMVFCTGFYSMKYWIEGSYSYNSTLKLLLSIGA